MTAIRIGKIDPNRSCASDLCAVAMSVCNADSKLVLSYLCGGRDAEWANRFMKDLASRLTTRIQITTDGHRAYAEAVEGAFGMDVDYAMLIKLYGAPSDRPDTRYSPAQCIGIRTGTLSGSPDPRHVSTSYVERQNLNLRMGVRRFTRLTNAFSKKFENHCHMVAIYHAYYNFCRVHTTLRVTPAMEAGLTGSYLDTDRISSLTRMQGTRESRLVQLRHFHYMNLLLRAERHSDGLLRGKNRLPHYD